MTQRTGTGQGTTPDQARPLRCPHYGSPRIVPAVNGEPLHGDAGGSPPWPCRSGWLRLIGAVNQELP